ncbi:MAG: ribonuclease E/G [Candidatus Melainabacteria bacterium]|nr:MAG: ribonuclease E/G [Candidatus Melainabacteria bacterium]
MNSEEKKIVIAERDNIAAVLEGKKVQEFFVTRGEILLGDIYLASVENILPSIEAAFVNVGSDKMGFLHTEDVLGKGALKDKLSPKQKIMVQVVKEPVGHKGPRVTMEISLPGRFLVLLPNETGVNVSRKIEGVKERARLKSIVNLLKPVGVGVIVRTEAEGQSEADIQEDLEILLEKWNNIVTTADTVEPPTLISRDQDLLYRVLREACTEDISEIIVDTAFAMNRVQQLLQNWHMNKNVKVTLYKGIEPLLVATDIHKEIKAALQTKVNMPSGGYLFIQTTEALTVIDVNSGKFTSSATQDETIFKTNKEAVHEIARQLRLRNIGGMIVIDFIDMTSRVDKLAILEEFELALEPDKAKPQIGQISDLGLVELTRHRQGQSISELFTKKCPHCQGTGCFMDDFKFASPVQEGEQRAKAAKAKSPMMNFRKNNEEQEENKNNQNAQNNQNNKHKNNKFNKNKRNNFKNSNETVQPEIANKPEQVEEVSEIKENVEVKDIKEEVKEVKEAKPEKKEGKKKTSRKPKTEKAEKVEKTKKTEKVEEKEPEVKPKKRGRKPKTEVKNEA